MNITKTGQKNKTFEEKMMSTCVKLICKPQRQELENLILDLTKGQPKSGHHPEIIVLTQ